MKKGNTVYEDKAAKEEARKAKRLEKIKKHAVDCPHCGKSVLDHMTKCPYCGGELTPTGYRPPDEKSYKRIKTAVTIVTVVVAVALLLFLVIRNSI